MAETWVVLLEAAADRSSPEISSDDVARLLALMKPGAHGAALHCAERYALQVTARAATPDEALAGVLARWANALSELGFPAWRVARAEVLTPEELQHDLEGKGTRPGSTLAPAATSAINWDGDDELARELLRRAFSDPVTGLPGRDAFEDVLRGALARAAGPHGVTVICLRLEMADLLENRLGAAAREPVPVAVSRRLGSMLRPGDAVACVRADEFAVLLEGLQRETARVVAARILDVIRSPLTPNDPESTPGVWAGVAVGQPSEDATAVLGRAEAAAAWATTRECDEPLLFRPSMSDPPPSGFYPNVSPSG